MNDDAARRAERARELRDEIDAADAEPATPSEAWRPGESPAEFVHRRMHELGEAPDGGATGTPPAEDG